MVFSIARALLMNKLVSGLGVRFLTVMMPEAIRSFFSRRGRPHMCQ